MLEAFTSKLLKFAGRDRTERHPEWDAEVQLEVVRAVSEQEKRSVLANLIGWFSCVAAAIAMPSGEVFALPLALRLFSIFYVRFAWARFREQMKNHEPYETSLKLAKFSLVVSAAFWAFLLVPIAAGMTFHPLSFVILTVTTIGISLVCTLLGPLPKLLFGYYGIFMATILICVIYGAGAHDFWVPMFVVAAGSGIIAYALGSGRETRASAETIIENRRLSYELGRALSRAKRQAERDPLTGLMNRRAFFKAYADWPDKDKGSTYLMTVDLDHFKAINDTYGHEIGDKVLVQTAQQIRGVLKGLPGKSHVACRFGGEEFVIISHGLDRHTGQAVAEALRTRINQLSDLFTAEDATVSASIGFVEMTDDESLDDALRRSDLAMYRAKNRGRDRVEIAA